MNDTPQGDGNHCWIFFHCYFISSCIRMNDTPQGDGNAYKDKYSNNDS